MISGFFRHRRNRFGRLILNKSSRLKDAACILGPKATPTMTASILIVLKPHNTLEESVAARHVIWMQSRKILLQYWEWCSIHSRAFVAIAVSAPRSRYAVVELDLYGLGAGGFDKEAGEEILRAILEQPLKAGSVFIVSPTYISACCPGEIGQSVCRSHLRHCSGGAVPGSDNARAVDPRRSRPNQNRWSQEERFCAGQRTGQGRGDSGSAQGHRCGFWVASLFLEACDPTQRY